MSFWGGKDTRVSLDEENSQQSDDDIDLVLDGDEDIATLLVRCMHVKDNARSIMITESMLGMLSTSQAVKLVEAMCMFKRLEIFEIHFPEEGIKRVAQAVVTMMTKAEKLHTLIITNMEMEVYANEFIIASQKHGKLKNIKVLAAEKKRTSYNFKSSKVMQEGMYRKGHDTSISSSSHQNTPYPTPSQQNTLYPTPQAYRTSSECDDSISRGSQQNAPYPTSQGYRRSKSECDDPVNRGSQQQTPNPRRSKSECDDSMSRGSAHLPDGSQRSSRHRRRSPKNRGVANSNELDDSISRSFSLADSCPESPSPQKNRSDEYDDSTTRNSANSSKGHQHKETTGTTTLQRGVSSPIPSENAPKPKVIQRGMSQPAPPGSTSKPIRTRRRQSVSQMFKEEIESKQTKPKKRTSINDGEAVWSRSGRRHAHARKGDGEIELNPGRRRAPRHHR